MVKFQNYTIVDDDERDLQKVYEFILRKGITYPTEISKELLMDSSRILGLVNKLIIEKEIKRVVLDPYQLHPKLAKRLRYFWNMKIVGFNNFNALSWLEINDDNTI